MKLKGIIALCLILIGPVLLAQKDSTAISASVNLKRFMTFYFESIKHRAMENPELALKALEAANRISDLNQEQISAIAYEQGKNYVLLQDFDRATRAFELAQSHPDFNAAAQTSLYDIYHQQGADENETIVVQTRSKVDEDYLQYYELLEQGVMDQALMILKNIINAEDLTHETKAQAVEAFAAQSPEKQYQESFDRLVPQLERTESAPVEVALGRYFLDRLDIEKAQKHGKKALVYEPNSKDALLLLASVAYASGDDPSGLQHAEMALALYPADPGCYLMAAKGYRYTGVLDLAEMQILSGLEFTLAGSNHYRLLCLEAASLYKDLGREKEAELWLDKAHQ